MYHILFVHSFIIGHLGCFHIFWSIVNSAAINMSVWISLQDPAFSSFGYVPRIGIAGLHSSSVFFIF